MKLKLFFFLSALIFPGLLNAASVASGDTTFTYDRYRLNVSEREGLLTVQAFQDSSEVKQVYEARFGKDSKHETWLLSESVSFPFSGLIGKKEDKKSCPKFRSHWSGIGFGFCRTLGNGLQIPGRPGEASVDFGNSFEIYWNVFSIRLTPVKKNWIFFT